MNAAQHYVLAEDLLADASHLYAGDIHSARAGKLCALAKIHAQLAQVGATLLATYPGLDKARDQLADAATGDGR